MDLLSRPSARIEIVGVRPGEKIHEEMITPSDGPNTIDIGKYYLLTNSNAALAERYISAGAKRVPQGFSYNSADNDEFLTVEQLRSLIREHVDPAFSHEGF